MIQTEEQIKARIKELQQVISNLEETLSACRAKVEILKHELSNKKKIITLEKQ